MKDATFHSLTETQQVTMIVAMQVRNAMETFHVDHLTDAQMKELNQIVRQGIFDGLSLVHTDLKDEKANFGLAWLMQMVPDYWEILTEDHPLIDEEGRVPAQKAA